MRKKLFWIVGGFVTSLFLFATLALLMQTPILAMASLGEDIVGFLNISKKQVSQVEETIGEGSIDEIRRVLGPEFRSALDCSNLLPSERRPGVNCIEGLLYSGKGWSPIPEDKNWLIPVWMRAARKYNIPWQLLAAVNGSRTSFGRENCETPFGSGFYRNLEKLNKKYSVNAGSTELSEDGLGCYRSESPAILSESKNMPKGGNTYDAVDATFTMAHQLSRLGAKKEWKYSGSPANFCTAEVSDGPVWYVPTKPTRFGPGAALGWNKNLTIPRRAVLLAAKYRSDKGKYRPRRTGIGGYYPMPKKDIVYLLRVAWTAFGVRDKRLGLYISKNYAQIGTESGGRPYVLQGFIGDVNDNNPAGGLFQFISSTFDHWNVDGFNDRFNPLDNILAAVNAQVNGPYTILDGSSGWSPPFSPNPYATGGKVKIVSKAYLNGKVPSFAYRGLAQTDSTSRAVANLGSPCYIAIVYDWYRSIKNNPPEMPAAFLGGPNGTQKVVGGGRLVPCPRKIPQDTSNACYIDRRIKKDVLWLHQRFGIYIQDGYSGPLPRGSGAGCWASGYQCHATNGEHPLGLALDIGPPPGKSWKQIDKLARWAEPRQNEPKAPFRWVGYNGDYNHGSGNHLHLSWEHSFPAVPYKTVRWVLVMKLNEPPKKQVLTLDPEDAAEVDPPETDLRARVSWFNDRLTASGINGKRVAGLALNLKPGTRAGWDNKRTNRWMRAAARGRPFYARVTIRGRTAVFPIIDKGPNQSTGRGIDLTLPAVRALGWKRKNFPTDALGRVMIVGQKKRGKK